MKIHLISIASNADNLYNGIMGAENWNLIDFECLNCGKVIKGFPSRNIKYCGECSKDRKIEVTCEFCGSSTFQNPSRNAKFCNRACWHNAQFGKTYDKEFGQKISKTKLSKPTTNDAAGRKRANTYLYPTPESCEKCGATKGIDRHHIDKNPQNNGRDNIAFLCKLHHQRLHKNWLDRWSKR